ncbi:uncharacterized protein LOC132758227, partial [Ruditapes philippinarum]|uniref:uncharacterized protein LOC132758227 n=1 Tax=Ruditapes philippinarum TaxID=129788 RepID=UPI00295B140B
MVESSRRADPAFAVNDVGPSEAGAAIVRSYTETDYPFDEQQLYDMGKSDMMITLVSAVCSNIHLIDLGEWEPPVPRVLNSDGYVMDLNPKGNKDVGRLDEVIADADNKTTDPATLAVQDVMARMINFTRNIVENDLNGSRSGDKMLASLVTNAFTNLVAQPRYLNYESMINIIYLARIVGFDALLPQNASGDNAAQTETSSGEIYFMFQEIVRASVPDDFIEIRPVGNLASGRNNIDEMLLALSENISLYDSQLSPVERAYLYVRMQKHLKYNTEEKKKTAKEAANMTLELAQEVQNQWKLCRRCSNARNSKTNQLLKNDKSNKFMTKMTATATSKFRIDGLGETLENLTYDTFDTVSVSAFEFQENVYMYDNDSTSSFVTSKVLRVDVKSVDTRVTPGYMTFQQTVITPIPEYVIPEVHEEDVSEFMYHRLIYQKSTDELCIIIEPQGLYNFTEYRVYIKYSSVPSIIDFDFNVYVKGDFNWQLCIPPEKMRSHTGLTYMAVQLPGNMTSVAYNLTIVTVGCLTWEEKRSKWHTDKCELQWKPDENLVSCFCKDITDLVFSNSFFVAPNSIDFNTVFLRFSPLNQAAVIGTFSVLFVCYIVAVIFLSGLDRQDSLKWGITPLRDNTINEINYYIIKVFTGMRRGAGTKSRVAFVLTGSNGSTRPRELYDGVREEFSTGSVMSFFMSTNQPLGDLLHLYIWHDNSGGSQAEWYLNQVVVYDIETLKAYTFVAERWLSVNTHIDACLPSSPCNYPIKFESRFFFQLRDKFSENHTWISIIYRPQTSTFTRVQRVSCALAFIFLTMLANAMYFNPEPNYISPAILEVGPFRFTKQQIYISIICAAITTPPIMLIVYIFQHTRRRKQTNDDHKKRGNTCCRKQRSATNEDRLREIQLSSETPELNAGLVFPF